MSVSEDLIQPSSDSFWEVDCYKRTVKRHEDGHKLCGDLIALIQERADIEKHYAKSLKDWSSKWNKLIEKGPEYGTSEGAWKGVLCEADQVAELHTKVKDSLLNDVQNQIKQWRTENYTKPMVGAIKETKELEDGFRKAQKPWAKRLVKVLKAKKEYHMACKLEKTATHQENNARADSAVSPDQKQALCASASAEQCAIASVESLDEKGRPHSSFSCGSLLRPKKKPKDSAAKLKKLQDKVEKCKNDVETTKKKYEQALNEINSYNAKYMEDMTEIFNKSQEYEEKRLKFFKEMMFGVQQCLNLSETDDYVRIYKQLWSTIENADHTKDLRWWSQNNGIDMAMNWPTFEDYSPEHRNISGKSKKGGGGGIGGSDGITLTAIQKNDSLSHNPVQQTDQQQHSYDNYSMTNNQNNQQNRSTPKMRSSPVPPKRPKRPASMPPKPVTPPQKTRSETVTGASTTENTPPLMRPRAGTTMTTSISEGQATPPLSRTLNGSRSSTGRSTPPRQPAPPPPPPPTSTPKKEPPPVQTQVSYDPNLNPFADDDPKLNPFADDDPKLNPFADEDADSLNPFADDLDEDVADLSDIKPVDEKKDAGGDDVQHPKDDAPVTVPVAMDTSAAEASKPVISEQSECDTKTPDVSKDGLDTTETPSDDLVQQQVELPSVEKCETEQSVTEDPAELAQAQVTGTESKIEDEIQEKEAVNLAEEKKADVQEEVGGGDQGKEGASNETGDEEVSVDVSSKHSAEEVKDLPKEVSAEASEEH